MMNLWKAIALGVALTAAAALLASQAPSGAPPTAAIEAVCGSCPANKLCCFDCSGQPYCAPKRMHRCPLLPCPPPAAP
ncbi:MAG TPA: hypothetical protein VGR38_13110 [Candidatus Polarisedimenticolia bacterium]|jgi:hypothetical protein|nr:hypothetical protein [Candidatus Polarisedimenticolia bacterium]